MKTVTITCDQCGKDLSCSVVTNAVRVVLQWESIQPTPHAVTLGEWIPPFTELHFCGVVCLSTYVTKAFPVR